MTSAAQETRPVSVLRTGTKICVLIALLLLVAAVYFYFVPMTIRTTQGGVFDCGSAASPPSEEFPKNVCANLTDINRYRAYAVLAAAIVTAAVGFLFFGTDKHEQVRRDLPEGGRHGAGFDDAEWEDVDGPQYDDQQRQDPRHVDQQRQDDDREDDGRVDERDFVEEDYRTARSRRVQPPAPERDRRDGRPARKQNPSRDSRRSRWAEDDDDQM